MIIHVYHVQSVKNKDNNSLSLNWKSSKPLLVDFVSTQSNHVKVTLITIGQAIKKNKQTTRFCPVVNTCQKRPWIQ